MAGKEENKRDLMRYAGLGVQFLVAIGIAVFFGIKADEWIKLSFPLMVWLLPLLMIFGITFKIIRETSKKSGNE